MSTKCPICKCTLKYALPVEINQLLICSNCGVELEVVWLYPLELVRNTRSNPDLDPDWKFHQKGRPSST